MRPRGSNAPSPRIPTTLRRGTPRRGCARRSAIRSAARVRSQRAAEYLAEPALAAMHLREAAARCAAHEPNEALAMLRTAVARAPGDAAAHAQRAALAAVLGRDEEAEIAARAALEIAPGAIDEPARAAVARTGAEAARRRGRAAMAASLYTEALQIEPDDAATLGAYGETLVALGDHPAARRVLERRLANAAPYPERVAHYALLGRCLELAGDREEALAPLRRSAALRRHARRRARSECARARSTRPDRARNPGDRALGARGAAWRRDAARLLRAAQWELRRGGRAESAERHLRAAVSSDPRLAPAWIALAGLLIDAGRLDAAIEATDRAAAHVHDAIRVRRARPSAGPRARAEGRAPRGGARVGIAAECDRRCADAALAQARLLRGFGEWRERRIGAALVHGAPPERARTRRSRTCTSSSGRLLAGPLEDLEGAVLTYRRAIELAPERIEARAALAEL
jgi:tetratricopeptide (TPR) repeat protein